MLKKKKVLICLIVSGLLVFGLAWMTFARGNQKEDRLTFLAGSTSSQILSAVIETSGGKLIVIDGGVKGDGDNLLKNIKQRGGHVAVWLVTHPHSDHVGALTELLNRDPIPVKIDNIYCALTNLSWYHAYEPERAGMVDEFYEALGHLPKTKVHKNIGKGQEIIVDDLKIKVLNDLFLCEDNAINNSSIAFRLDSPEKSVIFLGDMGQPGGEQLLAGCDKGELKADMVQMAHHGESGVSKDVYEAINPEICLWPTPRWLWENNMENKGMNTGPWKTLETRRWIEELGVKKNIGTMDGVITIGL